MTYQEIERIQDHIEKLTSTMDGNEVRLLRVKSDQDGPFIIGDLRYSHSEDWNLFQLWRIDGRWDSTLRTGNENDLHIN